MNYLEREDYPYERALFECSEEPIFLLDLAGHCLDVNPAGRSLFRIPIDEIQIGFFFSLISPVDLASVERALQSARQVKQTTERLTLVAGPDAVRWHVTYIPVVDEDTVRAVYVILRKPDVPAALLSKGETLQLIEENISDFIAVLDTHGVIRYASPSHEKIFGIPVSEVLGKRAVDLVHPEDAAFVQERMMELLRQEVYEEPVEIRYKNRDGLWLMTEIRGNPIVQGDSVTSIVIVAREVSRRKQAESFIHYMAYHDLLTGLPNRLAFSEKLAKSIDGSRPSDSMTALIMLDLDGFKQVNDTSGHAVGDQLLQAVAVLLTETVGPFGFVARLAGDEFVIVVPSVSVVKDVSDVAHAILDAFQTSLLLNEEEFLLTGSIGISVHPIHGTTVDTLLTRADQALYVAKGLGKNQYAIADDWSLSMTEALDL